MSPVPANPLWLNFSSMFREAITAAEVGTGMEKSHHLTASLYFGIAALEAFLNQKMRAKLTPIETEQEIFDRLRKRGTQRCSRRCQAQPGTRRWSLAAPPPLTTPQGHYRHIGRLARTCYDCSPTRAAHGLDQRTFHRITPAKGPGKLAKTLSQRAQAARRAARPAWTTR